MKIFAIDDERASLYFLQKAIKEATPNDSFSAFEDYEGFITAFKKELPDIVFLDVEMPEINGLDLARQLIKIKRELNIIFVTAFSEYAIEAFEVNATSYGYYVDLKKANCDLINFMKGDYTLFNGEYMEQYSWAEEKKCNFDKKTEK